MHLQVWNTLSLRLWSEKSEYEVHLSVSRLTLSEHLTASAGYLYHLQHILLPSQHSPLKLLVQTINPNSFGTKLGVVDERNSRTVLTFFRWHFCIFLFVERCFWLSAPALYHSAHHASVTTLCKVRIYLLKDVYDLSWFMMHQQSYCVSTVILWCDGRFAFINYLGLSIIHDGLMMKNVICFVALSSKEA